MLHGGEIYDKKIELDFSVSLNPCPCPDEVLDAIRAAAMEVQNYPDIHQTDFRFAVSKAERALGAESISPECIIGGNGASELLMAIVNMVRPKKALLPVPSFYGYEHVLKAQPECEIVCFGIGEEDSSLQDVDEFELTDRFVGAISDDIDLVILGNPNNPTAKLISGELLIKILKRCDEVGATLIVDECFYRLSKASDLNDGNNYVSARDYVCNYSRLFVVDAYTKLFSIPGVRVGFAIASPDNINRLRKFLPEWNISAFAIRAGIKCAEIIADGFFIRKSYEMIESEKDFLSAELTALGIRVFASDTNYILIQIEHDLYTSLLERGILIRDCSNFFGLKNGFYRIAVKDHVANQRLIQEIAGIADI